MCARFLFSYLLRLGAINGASLTSMVPDPSCKRLVDSFDTLSVNHYAPVGDGGDTMPAQAGPRCASAGPVPQ